MEGKRPHKTRESIPKETEGTVEAKPRTELRSGTGVTKSPTRLRSQEGRPDIEVTFIHVLHTLKYVDEIYEKAKDADIILFEMVGQTRQERESDIRLFNVYSILAQRDPNDPTVRGYIDTLRDSKNFGEHLVAKILEEGGGKEIGYIDVSEENPLYDEAEKPLELDRQIRSFVFAGWVKEARGKFFRNLVETLAISDAKRENFVVEQLREKLRNSKGKKKVAVIQGAAHTSTFHTLKREKVPAQRTFAPLPAVFSPTQALARKRRFFPEKDISDEEYLRALVGDYLIIPGAAVIWPEAQTPERDIFANKLLARLSNEEIDSTLDRFAKIREGKGGFGRTSLEDLPKVKEKRKQEFQADVAKVVRELAERHDVTIKTDTEEDLEKSQ